jgi:hypothetical protein
LNSSSALRPCSNPLEDESIFYLKPNLQYISITGPVFFLFFEI